jgi:hypothetical protein
MHIYRYRSSGLLSQKELLYDEMYFASKEELNDPIEMQSKFEFSDVSGVVWSRLLNELWSGAEYVQYASSYFSSKSPVIYSELLSDFESHRASIIRLAMESMQFQISDFDHMESLLDKLYSFLTLYEPASGYSVSFSKSNNEMLMWSHYAGSHSGYCLIFRPINGELNQCSERVKDSLSVSAGCISSMPRGFKVEDVRYHNEIKEMDGFSLFPVPYTGYSFDNEVDRLKYHADASSQLLTKNECWGYESECRLLLPQPKKWVSGESSYTPYQRIFHYDFRQVVGVIFGARMTNNDRVNIKEIIESKLATRFSNISAKQGKDYIFDFLYQEAEICSSSRQVKINDLELVSMGTTLESGSDYYNKQLGKWKKYEGMVMESGKFTYENIP